MYSRSRLGADWIKGDEVVEVRSFSFRMNIPDRSDATAAQALGQAALRNASLRSGPEMAVVVEQPRISPLQ